MPNHVCNNVTFEGDFSLIERIMKEIALDVAESEKEPTGVGTIDFNKIIPEPKYKNGNDWYDWRIKHWGTKWNAYEQSKQEESNKLRFWTAWSTPVEIFEALSKKYPDITVRVEFADEDIGCNCGRMTFKKGKLIKSLSKIYKNYSRYSLQFAKKVWREYDEEE